MIDSFLALRLLNLRLQYNLVPLNYRNDKMDSFQSLSTTVGEPSIMDFTIYL
jgi:hypothetical protein